MSPHVVLPLMAAVITIDAAERLKRRLLERRLAQPLRSYAVALMLIATNALAVCATSFMLAGLASRLTVVSWY